ncbi:DNA polymerase III, alpha subunit [Beutenbergia cavernae DSM 12333]|uniref:Error-prone DNA polymerase n=1 Tax=Beutenbergia cavernae (strain ATCC BAA-8 / DSM 12333 / CCUG 43141 / JCM 11478 / NBRC 16432 / NCIMB 13614 / HKI 0122) TaxID=471853 RepID=C5BVF1_BEUC1|nr:error-prone DNA polymerase [Beutenbergia cavernae]ACQ80538.1 DNA polymerase III, alpha subunit [Beutenbergia cavernae DSM 12333]
MSTTDGARYAELHAHSAFSFLDGASQPEALVAEAARLELDAVAITDHDGLYGVVRFAEAARALGMRSVFGAELSLDQRTPATGVPDPDATHLVVLARGPAGYHRLSRAIATAHLATGKKGERDYGHAVGLDPLEVLAEQAAGDWLVLTGCRKGAVRRALDGGADGADGAGGAGGAGSIAGAEHGERAAARELDRLVALFGRDNVAVELTDLGAPADSARCDTLADLAARAGLPVVATGGVHCAHPREGRLVDVLAAVRARRSLEEIDGWLPPAPAHLRSADEMLARHARHPQAVRTAAELGLECAFDLTLVAPRLPPHPVPPGYDEASWLRELTMRCARTRYGTRDERPDAYAIIDRELDIIVRLGFPGYFLIVHEIVDFCVQQGILCQGRGSAANSAVCYALGITAVDAVQHKLLFERFLSDGRSGPPDIDVDIESGRREEVIQFVYTRYGREHAAQVANVISYRPRSAVRDAARAFGYDVGQQDAWSKGIERWGTLRGPDPGNPDPAVKANATSTSSTSSSPSRATGTAAGPKIREKGVDTHDPAPPRHAPASAREMGEIPNHVLDVAEQMLRLPRHLGIHSGGMVLCHRPVIEVCPVEWATMPGRTVLQWDKDDCADAGLVKFDLLGLGMLTALRLAFEQVEATSGERLALHSLPQEDPKVYELLCAADTVGVFQVESRAQISTLPRLKPRNFYDIVVEVALIRPGPIQGNSVHPFIRRRNGKEKVTYLHPLLEGALSKTLGIPLFQEQLMQIAIDVAGFSGSEADQLRRAMGSKRSLEKMEALHERLLAGMADRGVPRDVGEQIYDKLKAFSDFGFPESHAFSFAYLVYASAWLKIHHPEAFFAGLLGAQPMGFYSPASLVADARRHGVVVRRASIADSAVHALVEHGAADHGAVGLVPRATQSSETWLVDAGKADARGAAAVDPALPLDPAADAEDADGGPSGRRFAVRLGLAPIRGIGEKTAERIVTERDRAPFADAQDLARRVRLTAAQLEALATAGALRCFGTSRREALWSAGALAGESGRVHLTSQGTVVQDVLGGTASGVAAPALPGMDAFEVASADVWATGLSPDRYPTEFVRPGLDAAGVRPVATLGGIENGARVEVGGVVTHRQRPGTAGGVTFLSLEDETGLLNVICSPGLWARYRQTALRSPALVVRGTVERADGVVNLMADGMRSLELRIPTQSRDFH